MNENELEIMAHALKDYAEKLIKEDTKKGLKCDFSSWQNNYSGGHKKSSNYSIHGGYETDSMYQRLKTKDEYDSYYIGFKNNQLFRVVIEGKDLDTAISLTAKSLSALVEIRNQLVRTKEETNG